MFITRKKLARRTFLKGVGASLALPMLDAMTPAMSAATKSPARLAFIYVPNGVVNLDWWKPTATGSDYQFTRILKPLESLRKDFFILFRLAG